MVIVDQPLPAHFLPSSSSLLTARYRSCELKGRGVHGLPVLDLIATCSRNIKHYTSALMVGEGPGTLWATDQCADSYGQRRINVGCGAGALEKILFKQRLLHSTGGCRLRGA